MKVLNIRQNDNGHYIGRGGKGKKQSALANPFKIGVDGNREECIAKYRKWLWVQIQNKNKGVLDELDFIRENKPDLVCFCAPLPCHGDVIIRCVNWMECYNEK